MCQLQVMSRHAAFESTDQGRSSMTHHLRSAIWRLRFQNSNIFILLFKSLQQSNWTKPSQFHVRLLLKKLRSLLIICPLLMWFSDYTSISAILTSPTFRRWSTKDPTKVADIAREHQMRQVLFHDSGPDTGMSKEVVSIRAIWERISFVGPVPAKHRPPFCYTPEMKFLKRNFSTVCQRVYWNQFWLCFKNSHFCNNNKTFHDSAAMHALKN